MKHKIIVTGANNSIGQSLLHYKSSLLYEVHAIVEKESDLAICLPKHSNIFYHEVGDLAHCAPEALISIFENASVVIHLAAVIIEDGSIINSATVNMAHNVALACSKASVKNIIHLSSISARLVDEHAPNARSYGERRLAAEKAFREHCANSSAVVTLRSPAEYGKDTAGPLSKMISLVRKGIPLPFGLANQKRDYISVNNTVDLIWKITEKQTSGRSSIDTKTYEPCDGKAVTTKELTKEIAKSLGKKTVLIPIPAGFMSFILKLVGKADLADGAFERLEARGNPDLLKDFGWTPVECIPESLSYLKS